MKKLLLPLMILCSLAGAGQTRTVQYNGVLAFDTLPHRPTYYATPKYDTVAILYLYADTATFEAFGAKQRNPAAYWDFGYEVLELTKWVDEPGTYCGNCPPYSYEHCRYLDRQKQPIRKSIVIFMTKTISNDTKQ